MYLRYILFVRQENTQMKEWKFSPPLRYAQCRDRDLCDQLGRLYFRSASHPPRRIRGPTLPKSFKGYFEGEYVKTRFIAALNRHAVRWPGKFGAKRPPPPRVDSGLTLSAVYHGIRRFRIGPWIEFLFFHGEVCHFLYIQRSAVHRTEHNE